MSPQPVRAATHYETGISTNASLLRMNDDDLNDRLNDIQNLGASWIRVDFSWPIIQPNNSNDFDWTLYDRLVQEAGVHHLKILAVLSYTPQWARQAYCDALVLGDQASQKCGPRSRQEFAHFAAVAAFRYHSQSVRAWEIWNEPNLSGYWKTARADNSISVDPQAYADMANAAAQQIRYHDPDAVIITGGLAPMFEPRYTTGMRQSDYLTQMLRYLHPEYFDAIGIHPYTWPLLPSQPVPYNAFYTVDNGQATYNLRTILVDNGWGDKEIWATEFGASTQGLRVRNDRSAIQKYGRPDHVSESMQAQIIQQALIEWYQKANVGPLFVNSDSDQWLTPLKQSDAGFGLRHQDGSKKPAYEAFQIGTRQL